MDFGFLKKIFRFGKKEEDFSDFETPALPPPTPSYIPPTSTGFGLSTSESVASENLKAKIDLVMTQMDSLKIQYESINQRLIQIEKLLRDMSESSKTTPRF